MILRRLGLTRMPSTLAAMLSLFAALRSVQKLQNRETSDRLAELLKPGVDFLGKWMGLFLAPPLASLDASIARLPPYSGKVWANTTALLGVGWGATHAAAAGVASSLVPAERAPAKTAAAAAAAPVTNGNHEISQEEAVRRSWVLLGAAGFLGVACSPALPLVLHRPFGILCEMSTTVCSFSLSKLLPDAVQRVLHPLVVCAVSSNLASRFVGPVAPYFDEGRGVGCPGAPDGLRGLRGFNVETLHRGNLRLIVWDIGGQEQLRKIWTFYCHGTNGLIFVVDSSDHQRIKLLKDEVEKMLQREELAKAVLLFFANKQDVANAMSVEEIIQKLDLEKLCSNRTWFVQSSVATTGDGLFEGLDWLTRTLGESDGVGDRFFQWLPAAVTGLGVRMYNTTDKWLDNADDFKCVLATCSASGCFSIFLTTLGAVNPMSPLSIPAPLSLPLLHRSVMSALGIEGSQAIGPECDPKLAVASILITGCIGASLGNSLLNAFPAIFRASSPLVRGVAMGCSAHSIGTAGLISLNDTEAAAISGASMCLAGTMHTLVLQLPGVVTGIRSLWADGQRVKDIGSPKFHFSSCDCRCSPANFRDPAGKQRMDSDTGSMTWNQSWEHLYAQLYLANEHQ
ncbi:unnamed protein product [Cladocopium goreaui]|uniref:ADP-ribosylation factor 1 n=1 Tax=Cladocopium goreaui TaxID=2562237 RepID=A0A9P1DSR3_9DINO|nr:unnamed protein product [Cladocopium goreaui]